MAPDQIPAPWEVIQQVEKTDLGPGGAYVPGMTITFRTAGGVTGSVFVPHADYTVDAVRKAIGARAAVLDTVAELRG